MRTGVVLDGRYVDRGGTTLVELSTRIEELGFDLVWLRADDRLPDPLAAAPLVAAATRGLRIGVEVPLGDVHPVLVAEAAAVADLAVGGRLVLGLRPADDTTAEAFDVGVEVVLRSHRPRPFRVERGPWPTPANLAENSFARERTVRVTPTPAQLELPTWLVGAPEVAVTHGLSPVLDDLSAAADHWAARDGAAGPPAWRLSRPAVVDVPTTGDRADVGLVDDLVRATADWGMDTALFVVPDDDPGPILDDLARVVRPRIQQEGLSPGLVQWWDHELRGEPDPTIATAESDDHAAHGGCPSGQT